MAVRTTHLRLAEPHRRRIIDLLLVGERSVGDLVAALRQLPEEQRMAIALHYLAGLPVADVAQQTGAPASTPCGRHGRGVRRRRPSAGGWPMSSNASKGCSSGW